MVIRAAREKDITVLVDMLVESTKEEDIDYEFPSYPEPPAKEVLAEWLAGAIKSPTAFVIVTENEDKIMAFMLSHLEFRPLVEPQRFGHVDMIYVRAENRNQISIAKNLVKTTKRWFKLNSVQFVETRTRASQRQVGRWVRKGWIPYSVNLWKSLEV